MKNCCDLSCWHRRTIGDKVCTVICLTLIVLLTAALVGVIIMYEIGFGTICKGSKCVHKASKVLGMINRAVDPCKDFYEFTCGAYITDEYTRDKTVLMDQSNKLNDVVKIMLTDKVRYPEPRFIAFPKMLYTFCIDQDRIIKDGIKPIVEFMEQFVEWPVVKGDDWNESTFNWQNTVRAFRLNGLPPGSIIQVNWIEDKTGVVLLLREGEVTPDIASSESAFNAYKEKLITLAVRYGANETAAAKEMHEVVDFEVKLTKIAEKSRQVKRASLTTLQEQYPYLEWFNFIRSSFGLNVQANEIVLIVPTFFESLGSLLDTTPKRVIANYMMAKVYLFSSELLPKAVIYGGPKEPFEDRQKMCIDFIRSNLWLAVAALYHLRFFDPDITKNVQEMVQLIRQELAISVKEGKWMRDDAKDVALKRLLSLDIQIAFPLELRDFSKLEHFYSDLGTRSSRGSWKWIKNFFTGAMQALRKTEHVVSDISKENAVIINGEIANIREPIHKSADELNVIAKKVHTRNTISKFNLRKMQSDARWLGVSDQTQNYARYDPETNMLDVRAGVLRHELYSKEVPNYMNYGALGSIIAHELFHVIDNRRKAVDKDGTLKHWWQLKTKVEYEKGFKCLVDQYNRYVEPLTEKPVDGSATLEENIADNIGLSIAYRAYMEWLKTNGRELSLPGVEFTSNQLFWIASAQTQCANPSVSKIQKQLKHGNQAPERFRVIGSISNNEEFARDFNCNESTPMNPRRKCMFW